MLRGLKQWFIKSLLVPSMGIDVSFWSALLPVLPVLALQLSGVGWATPAFTCAPQIELLNEETRAQAGPHGRNAGMSFSKTPCS